MGSQSTPWVERVLRRLCRPWRQDAPSPRGLPRLADDRRAATPAGATAPSPTASLGQSAPGEGNTRCGEHLVRPAERRLLTQRTENRCEALGHLVHGPQRCRGPSEDAVAALSQQRYYGPRLHHQLAYLGQQTGQPLPLGRSALGEEVMFFDRHEDRLHL